MKTGNITFIIFIFTCTYQFFTGCGGKNKNEQTATLPPPKIAEEEEKNDASGMQVQGLTGSLGRDEVEMVMTQEGMMKVQMCLEWIYTKRDFVYGKVDILFQVAPDGKTSKVTFKNSDIGDYELEKCLQNRLGFLKFPKPKGGATEVNYSFTIDPQSENQKVSEMNSRIAMNALEEFRNEISECTGGKMNGLKLVFYFGETFTEEVENDSGSKKKKTEKKTFSHVLSVGGIAVEGSPDDAIECIFNASKGWKVPLNAGNYISKAVIQF